MTGRTADWSGKLGGQPNTRTKTAPAGSYTRPRPDHPFPTSPERRASRMVSMPEVSSHILRAVYGASLAVAIPMRGDL